MAGRALLALATGILLVASAAACILRDFDPHFLPFFAAGFLALVVGRRVREFREEGGSR